MLLLIGVTKAHLKYLRGLAIQNIFTPTRAEIMLLFLFQIVLWLLRKAEGKTLIVGFMAIPIILTDDKPYTVRILRVMSHI